jgi:hypothetical protein
MLLNLATIRIQFPVIIYSNFWDFTALKTAYNLNFKKLCDFPILNGQEASEASKKCCALGQCPEGQ